MREHVQYVMAIATVVIVLTFAISMFQMTKSIAAGNRAIGCILAIDVTERTDAIVDACFTNQGLTPP